VQVPLSVIIPRPRELLSGGQPIEPAAVGKAFTAVCCTTQQIIYVIAECCGHLYVVKRRKLLLIVGMDCLLVTTGVQVGLVNCLIEVNSGITSFRRLDLFPSSDRARRKRSIYCFSR